MAFDNCWSRPQVETACHKRRISFKGSLQAIRQWEPLLKHAKLRRLNRQQLLDHLYQLIGGLVVLERPGRREPRALKRRPKNFQLMTRPRHLMQEMPHRGRIYLNLLNLVPFWSVPDCLQVKNNCFILSNRHHKKTRVII